MYYVWPQSNTSPNFILQGTAELYELVENYKPGTEISRLALMRLADLLFW